MSKPSKEILAARDVIAEHLEGIRAVFKDPKITLVVRNSDLPDGDCIMSDDDLDLAIAAIRRLQEKAPYVIEADSRAGQAGEQYA